MLAQINYYGKIQRKDEKRKGVYGRIISRANEAEALPGKEPGMEHRLDILIHPHEGKYDLAVIIDHRWTAGVWQDIDPRSLLSILLILSHLTA